MVRPKVEEGESASGGKKKKGGFRTPEEQFVHSFVNMHREKGFTDSQLIAHSKKKWITLPAAKKKAWSESAKLEATKLRQRAKSAEARQKEMIANPYLRTAQAKKKISRQVTEVEEQGEEASKEDVEWAKEQEASLLTLQRKSESNRKEQRATSFTSTGDVEIGAPPRKRPRLNEVPEEIPDTEPLVTSSISSSGGVKNEEVREATPSSKKERNPKEKKAKKEEERKVRKEEEKGKKEEEKGADRRGGKRRESSRSRSDRKGAESEREEKSHKHKHRSHKEKGRDDPAKRGPERGSAKEEKAKVEESDAGEASHKSSSRRRSSSKKSRSDREHSRKR